MIAIRRAGQRLLRCEKGLAALEFVLLAPALLMIAFGIIIYSFYFAAEMGLRHAATEGARAAVAGLSTAERTTLARDRAEAVVESYGALLSAGGTEPEISTIADGSEMFMVRISYDMVNSPIMHYAGFIPLPSSQITVSAVVTNGSY